MLPNGVATGLDIGFSNASLSIITLSFYTMCKSSAPLFLLLCAFLWRIETPTWGLAGIVVVISTGLVMLVDGEVEFNLFGFFLVMSAAAMSGVRWTIAQVLLQVCGTLVHFLCVLVLLGVACFAMYCAYIAWISEVKHQFS